MLSKTVFRFLHTIACLILLVASLPLSAAPPSQAQLDEFIRASRIQDMLPSVTQAMDAEVRQIMSGLAQTLNLSGGEKQLFDRNVNQRLLPKIRHEMSWQQLEPLFREAFSQVLNAEDIQVALAFHHSAAGRAYQAVSIELLRDPAFIKSINDPDQLRHLYGQRLSPADFNVLVEYNNSAAGRRIEANSKQIMPQVMKRIEPRIEQIVQTFLEEELL